MNAVSNRLLIDFPREIQQHEIAEYLTIRDLNNCRLVSHVWKNLFDSDIMWEPIAKKLGIKKLEVNSIHQFLIETPTFFNWVPLNLKKYLTNDYKSLIQKKFLLEEENIQKKYPEEFLKVFDGAKVIQRLPAIEINFDEMINEDNGLRNFYYFKDEHFSSPIVRVTLKKMDRSEIYFVLFRIINNETGEIYRDAISFNSFARTRFFNIDNTRSKQRIICPSSPNVTKEKLNRLQRLIQKEAVGTIVEEERYIVEEERYAIVEGPKTMFNGKSVLELY
jgi:F-box domain